MSKIFQALEKAQVERVLHEHGRARRGEEEAGPPLRPSTMPTPGGQKMSVQAFKLFLAQLPDDAIIEVRLEDRAPIHFAQWKPLGLHEIRAVVHPAPVASEPNHEPGQKAER